MITRTVYIADDGEEFETEEECTAHERCMADLPGILGFNDKAAYQDPEKNDVDQAFNNSEYLFIIDENEADETFEFIGDYYGYTVPTVFSTGDILRYDYDKDEWVNAVDDYLGKTEMMIGLLKSIGETLQDEQLSAADATLEKIRTAVSGLWTCVSMMICD